MAKLGSIQICAFEVNLQSWFAASYLELTLIRDDSNFSHRRGTVWRSRLTALSGIAEGAVSCGATGTPTPSVPLFRPFTRPYGVIAYNAWNGFANCFTSRETVQVTTLQLVPTMPPRLASQPIAGGSFPGDSGRLMMIYNMLIIASFTPPKASYSTFFFSGA